MSDKPKNIGKSVADRLRNISKQRKLLFDDLLSQYANERLLYRLSLTPHANEFILKGGTLFLIWLDGDTHRATQDLDFLAIKSLQIADAEAIFKHLCTMDVDINDGIIFLPDTIQVMERQSTIHIVLASKIDTAIQKLSIDIGYGDVITPEIQSIDYPVLLPNMPIPKLKAYPKYTVIAEKFEAIVDLGIRNSRLKDFYDIWFICKHYGFNGTTLKTAIESTFERRKTPIPTEIPIAFTSEFYADKNRKSQWQSFLKKDKTMIQPEFDTAIREIYQFLVPIVSAIVNHQPFTLTWNHQTLMWE